MTAVGSEMLPSRTRKRTRYAKISASQLGFVVESVVWHFREASCKRANEWGQRRAGLIAQHERMGMSRSVKMGGVFQFERSSHGRVSLKKKARG